MEVKVIPPVIPPVAPARESNSPVDTMDDSASSQTLIPEPTERTVYFKLRVAEAKRYYDPGTVLECQMGVTADTFVRLSHVWAAVAEKHLDQRVRYEDQEPIRMQAFMNEIKCRVPEVMQYHDLWPVTRYTRKHHNWKCYKLGRQELYRECMSSKDPEVDRLESPQLPITPRVTHRITAGEHPNIRGRAIVGKSLMPRKARLNQSYMTLPSSSSLDGCAIQHKDTHVLRFLKSLHLPQPGLYPLFKALGVTSNAHIGTMAALQCRDKWLDQLVSEGKLSWIEKVVLRDGLLKKLPTDIVGNTDAPCLSVTDFISALPMPIPDLHTLLKDLGIFSFYQLRALANITDREFWTKEFLERGKMTHLEIRVFCEGLDRLD